MQDNSSTNGTRGAWGSFLAGAQQSFQDLTQKKYTLPDKNVASQLLMYRQLLHTPCRPGLKLSREYQGTPAQVAVRHMPWWSEGCQETGLMVISYDNLIARLWNANSHNNSIRSGEQSEHFPTPPIPHEDWVSKLGFQQTDPVTDFRSGGILSLAMMVHVTESCPAVHARFVRGDASVLPFAITSINITDMMAKFLMLAKSTDRMDALLSQKPFWLMFADPNALTACQELSMDMLADVVVEMQQDREAAGEGNVTVFDFNSILQSTTRRVQYDLLGAGPKSVAELRAIRVQLKEKYRKQRMDNRQSTTVNPDTVPGDAAAAVVQRAAVGVVGTAAGMAGSVFKSFQVPGFNPLRRETENARTVPMPPADDSDGDWIGADMKPDGVIHFSIGEDDEEVV